MDGRFCKDEVEAEVHHRRGVDFLADAVAGLGQGLVAVQGVVAEGDERGHAGVGRRQRAQGVVVVAVEVDVGVDQPRQHELALGVYDPVGGRQQVLRGHRHDLLALDRHGGVKDLRRRHNLPAAYDGVNSRLSHAQPPWPVIYLTLMSRSRSVRSSSTDFFQSLYIKLNGFPQVIQSLGNRIAATGPCQAQGSRKRTGLLPLQRIL